MPELPPQDAQRRFQLVFRRFLGVFARPEHPLALFLDDLQWLDAATLDLLGDLTTQSDVGTCCCWAPSGTTRSARPIRWRAACRRSGTQGGRVSEIMLSPLARADVGQSRCGCAALHR